MGGPILNFALAFDYGDPGTDGSGTVVPGTDGPGSVGPETDSLDTYL